MEKDRRNTAQIFSDILDCCCKPIIYTHILVKANTSFNRLNAILGQLENAGLILKNTNTWQTTPSGMLFRDFIKSINFDITDYRKNL